MIINKSFPKIVFFGTPDFAVASLNKLIIHNFQVVAIVTAPDKPAGRGREINTSAVKDYALTHQIPILQPEKLKNEDFIDTLKSLQADLFVVVAFRMLPEIVWNMPPLGTINVHASLLPNYRGAAPINWAIINGEKETGVTTFKLQQEIDTGPILLQKKIRIFPDDDMGTLYPKLMELGAELLIETVVNMSENKLVEKPQDLTLKTKHAPKIFKNDCLINWNQKTENVHDFIRGLSPYPAAFTNFKGKVFKIFKSKIELAEHEEAIGNHVTDGKNYLKFTCVDGWIHALDIQFEGKKRMGIEEFLRGFRDV